MGTFYEHSGKAPPAGIALGFTAGAMAAILLAWVYSYADVYIPIVYLNLLLPFAFAAGIGVSVGQALRWGHVRSLFVAATVSGLCGVLGLYVAWGVDLLARVGFPEDVSFLMAFSPDVLAGYIADFYEEGAWTIGRGGEHTVSGIPLAIVWVIEAGIIVIFSAICGRKWLDRGAYCEGCKRWATTRGDVCRLNRPSDPEHLTRIITGDLKPLGETSSVPSDAKDYLSVDLTRCDKCNECNYVTLKHVSIVMEKDKEKKTSTTILNRLAITPEDFALVRGAAEGDSAT